ncbi:MAG TPA: hypothetical protein VGJ22_14455 [Anaerolineales bacterium]|jgi:hypothetical protein
MKRIRVRHIALVWIALVTLAWACNLPFATGGIGDAALTAAAQTVAAELTAAAALASPTPIPSNTSPAPTLPPPTLALPPTACSPIVTTTTAANVRGGPGTAYPILGFIPLGGTAPLAGRNDANTWWYIGFPAGPGGHAWIAQSITVATCLPGVVAVVAAPPLPPTDTPTTVSAFAVTGVSYDVNTFDEGSYDDCPIVTAHITANGPGDVQYHWTRSDGAGAPVQSVHFNSAGTKNVTQKWYLGSVWAGGSPEWLGVYIDDPNHQDFGHVNVPACNAP